MSIPEPHIPKGHIPERASNYPTEEDPESEPFYISFKYYNERVSELREGAIKNSQRKFLEDLIKMGRCTNIIKFKDINIDTTRVTNSGGYSKLFSTLPHGTDELKEHRGVSTSRLFYYIEKKKIYVVAFTQAHLETRKQFG